MAGDSGGEMKSGEGELEGGRGNAGQISAFFQRAAANVSARLV